MEKDGGKHDELKDQDDWYDKSFRKKVLEASTQKRRVQGLKNIEKLGIPIVCPRPGLGKPHPTVPGVTLGAGPSQELPARFAQDVTWDTIPTASSLSVSPKRFAECVSWGTMPTANPRPVLVERFAKCATWGPMPTINSLRPIPPLTQSTVTIPSGPPRQLLNNAMATHITGDPAKGSNLAATGDGSSAKEPPAKKQKTVIEISSDESSSEYVDEDEMEE